MNANLQQNSEDDEELRVFPKHIHIFFANNQADKVQFIKDKLSTYNFNPNIERALVFVSRRQDAEDSAAQFVSSSSCRTDYYHAGRDSGEKEAVAEQFKKGGISVLFATKAFGMGVDISNIRYVFHMTPPSSVEDYVQEIGRAGRDKKDACAFLLHSDSDFNKIRSRMIQTQLNWNMVRKMYDLLHHYRSKLTQAERNSFVVPDDLIAQEPALRTNLFGQDAAAVRQRMLLHSLEEAQRLDVGSFELTHWPVALGENESSDKNAREIQRIAEEKGATREVTTLLSERELREKLGSDSDNEAREQLFSAAKIGVVQIPFKVVIEWTKWAQDEDNKPHIAVVQKSAAEFLKNIWATEGDRCIISHKVIHASSLAHSKDKTKRQEENVGSIRFNERRPSLVRFLRHIEGLRVNNNKQAERYEVLGSEKVNWRETLKQLPERAECIIKHLYAEKPAKTIDELYKVAGAGLEQMRFKDLELTLQYLASLGIIRLDNDLIPTSVRVEIKNGFDTPFDTSYDEETREQLKERNRLRIYRLDALQVLTRTSSEERENFASNFFASRSLTYARQILLKQAFEVDEELHRQFADMALEEYYGKLTKEQQHVVCESQTKNLVVVAGPGTGKTYTLISCLVQRLIASERIEGRNSSGPIAAQDILVLAYTRAVVEELRNRTHELLKLLGRNERPRIHTFHSYAVMKLGETGRHDVDMSNAIDEFITAFKNGSVPDAPIHIFVDEFQDITDERARMLKAIIRSRAGSLVTVIGDPYQSIYDYDKSKETLRSSEEYFRLFAHNFNAADHSLAENFRCDKRIVAHSQAILKHNSKRDLKPRADAADGEVLSASVGKNLRQHAVEALVSHRQVAVLFRTNSELYTAMEELREVSAQNKEVALRILGGRGKIVYSREINTILEILRRDHADKRCNGELVKEIATDVWKQNKIVWEKRLVWHLLDGVWLFKQNYVQATITDFIEWVREDLAGNHILFASRLRSLHVQKKELVLSTIHRTKGLEFDAVIIAPSNMPLKQSSIEEERRLHYVAVTRAKHRLVLIDGPREKALSGGLSWEEILPEQRRVAFDTIDDGHGVFDLADFARKETEAYLLNEMREGDPLHIVGSALWHKNTRLCGMSEYGRKKYREQRYTGLFVSEIVRYDGFGEDNEYIDRYPDEVQQRGWYYVVNATGYLKQPLGNK